MAYASLVDVENVGLPATALGPLTVQQTSAILQSASDFADSYFRNRWGYGSVPLVTWDSSVTEAVAKIAAYRMVKVRGFRSNSAADVEFEKGYNQATDWLDKVQRQQATPLVTLANSNAPGSTQPNFTTQSTVNVLTGATGQSRGW